MEYEFCGAGDVATSIDVWFHAHPMSLKIQIWRLAFCALLWAIWSMKNSVIFHQGSFNDVGCFEMFQFDLVWWIKVEWDEQVTLVADSIRSPGYVEVPRKPRSGGCGNRKVIEKLKWILMAHIRVTLVKEALGVYLGIQWVGFSLV